MMTFLLFVGFTFVFLAGGMCVFLWQQRRGALLAAPVQAPTLVFLRKWAPLMPEQWAAAFRDWPESDPRWRALWDLLSHHLEAELAEMQGAKADPQEIVQRSGRVQMLLFLRSQILNLRGHGN